ncbi:unnamed protein product [Cyprideis torosa]|uniref:Uncharacterized protein n=1 Tax=Cyprideis torosa TaxID=163714 RepID=A0A7R8ZG72_9CRUS|nr:unnamed protein product [Cyprideis torosa]CAG0879420.1 unnamed protein product [Cyprideis torosa]
MVGSNDKDELLVTPDSVVSSAENLSVVDSTASSAPTSGRFRVTPVASDIPSSSPDQASSRGAGTTSVSSEPHSDRKSSVSHSDRKSSISDTSRPRLNTLSVPNYRIPTRPSNSHHLTIGPQSEIRLITKPSYSNNLTIGPPDDTAYRRTTLPNGESFPGSLSKEHFYKELNSITVGSSDGLRLQVRRILTGPKEIQDIYKKCYPNYHPASPQDMSSRPSFDASYDTTSESDNDDEEHQRRKSRQREQWSTKREFILAVVGATVGLGSVWRYPYLAYNSQGGGAFLLPYLLILCICGIPLLYMELAVGQYTNAGPIQAIGSLCPLLKGVGVSSVVVAFVMSSYYIIIVAWALYYMFNSFRYPLPWADCNDPWNSIYCDDGNKTVRFDNGSTRLLLENETRTPAQDFYFERVLRISSGINEPGEIRWELFLVLLLAWTLVYFSVWKSVKSTGKVVYFTALSPCILLIGLLIRTVALEGAMDGLYFFLKPNWERLMEAKVWVNAATQVYISHGLALGVMIAFSSYNSYNNKSILKDAVLISFANVITSVIAGLVVYATLGNIAHIQGEKIDRIVDDGPGMVFVIYSQAFSVMPFAALWAFLFYFVLLCLGLDTQFALVEVVVTSLTDEYWPDLKQYVKGHKMLVFIVCMSSLALGLPNITQGGIYFLTLVDYYTATKSASFLAIAELVAISWCYGAGRLACNIKEMTGTLPSMYFRVCWYFASPILIIAIWFYSLYEYEAPTTKNNTYEFPPWAEALGWILVFLSILPIFIFAGISISRAKGNSWAEKIAMAARSSIVSCPTCGKDFKCNAGKDESNLFNRFVLNICNWKVKKVHEKKSALVKKKKKPGRAAKAERVVLSLPMSEDRSVTTSAV